MKKPIIMIDPGHGGKELGATAKFTDVLIAEKDLNLSIALKTKTHLAKKGFYPILMTRHNDVPMSLAARVAIANNSQAHIFVSIHCNAFVNTNAFGIETYYYSDKGKQIAQKVQSSLITQTKAFNRTIKQSPFYVLVNTKMPAILVECGFMSNPKELTILVNEEYQNSLAIGIVNGLNALNVS